MTRTVEVWARILASRLGNEEVPAFMEVLQRDPVGLIAALCKTAVPPEEDYSPVSGPVFSAGFAAGYATASHLAQREYFRGFDYGRDWTVDEFRDLLTEDPKTTAAQAYAHLEAVVVAERRRG